MNRRAFTLLEVVLALALGTVIVGVAWALMVSVDRADRSIEAAGNDALELERARLVMSRMSSSILMAPGSDPRKLAPKEGEEEDKTKNRRRNRTGINPDDPLPTPRIMLGPDLAAGGVMTPERSILDPTLLAERMVPAGELGTGVVPQRLEVVLVDPPVPTSFDKFEAARRVLRRNADRAQRVSDAAAGAEDAEALADAAAEEPEPDVAVRAFRGIFQLRPETPTDVELARQARGEAVRPRWRLEWQALMPRGTFAQDSTPPEAIVDGPPRVIARDLVYANWVFFDNGERKTLYEGTWGSDLPAYVELEAETSRGVRVNWMFEIGWAFGPEVPPPTTDLSRIGDGSGKPGSNSGGSTPGGSTPGPSKPGGSTPGGSTPGGSTPGGAVPSGKGGGSGGGGKSGGVKGGGK